MVYHVAFVLTIDQRGSARNRDQDPIPGWADDLNRDVAHWLDLPFERTVGDEIQGVARDPRAVVRTIRTAARLQAWYVGIGIGEARLAESSRASRGPAFERARQAVEAAKKHAVPIQLVGERSPVTHHAETALVTLYTLLSERTERGWRVADLAQTTRTLTEVGAKLGITKQSVGRTARRAHVELERDLSSLAAYLLEEAA